MKVTKIAAAALAGVMLLGGCKLFDNGKIEEASDRETVIQIGDVEISKGLFKAYSGGFLTEESKDSLVDMLSARYGIVAVADAMGIKLSDEQQTALDTEYEEYKKQADASYTGGFEAFLENTGITDEEMKLDFSLRYYGEAVQNAESDISEEDEKEYFKDYYRQAKHILVSTSSMSDEEAKAKAEELLEKAKNGEDFDALIEENSDDPGSASNPDGYIFTDGDMVQEFQDGVDSIKPGEFTLVKSDFGYHVIQRVELDEDKYTEHLSDILAALGAPSFDDEESVKALMEEYNVKVDVKDDILNDIVKELSPSANTSSAE